MVINYKIEIGNKIIEGAMAVEKKDNIIKKLFGKISIKERPNAKFFINGERVFQDILKYSELPIAKKLQIRMPINIWK